MLACAAERIRLFVYFLPIEVNNKGERKATALF